MSVVRVIKLALLGSVFSLPMVAARAADLILYSPQPVAEQPTDLMLPAVSGINGKLEISGGFLRTPGTTIGHARVNGSISIPVTDRFGLQATWRCSIRLRVSVTRARCTPSRAIPVPTSSA